ncbi:MAG TPA: transcriptional repressor [Candidatus Acidoferrales bacterium]
MPERATVPEGYLEAQLLAKGVRMTRQRKAILRVIETSGEHVDAVTLLERARKLDRKVDRVTVYRTLGMLKKHGLVDELDLMHLHGGQHYYEVKPGRHHLHLACRKCARVEELHSELLDRLEGQIKREKRFLIADIRVEVGGLCARCQSDGAKP